jgi:hypothetical protein
MKTRKTQVAHIPVTRTKGVVLVGIVLGIALASALWWKGARPTSSAPVRVMEHVPKAAPGKTIANRPAPRQPERSAAAGKQSERPRLVRVAEDGTHIYRTDGMQITVLPNGEFLYLPDEL